MGTSDQLSFSQHQKTDFLFVCVCIYFSAGVSDMASENPGYLSSEWPREQRGGHVDPRSLRIIGRTSSKDNSDHPLDTADSKMASAVPQEQQRAMSNKLSDAANGEFGRTEAPKLIGSKKKYRSRSTSASSQDSLSSGSYTGSSSDEDGVSPREKIQKKFKR